MAKNVEKNRASARKYYYKNREAVLSKHAINSAHRNSKSKEWYEKNKEEVRRKQRIRTLWRYRLTPERYEEILASQGGVCKTCKRAPKKRRLDVDHDHAAEKAGIMRVRGLLCSICNHKILGMMERFKVSPEAFVSYLSSPPVHEVSLAH